MVYAGGMQYYARIHLLFSDLRYDENRPKRGGTQLKFLARFSLRFDEFCRIEIGDREVDLHIFPQLICILYVVLRCDELPST